jgi:hypothetical protein
MWWNMKANYLPFFSEKKTFAPPFLIQFGVCARPTSSGMKRIFHDIPHKASITFISAISHEASYFVYLRTHTQQQQPLHG